MTGSYTTLFSFQVKYAWTEICQQANIIYPALMSWSLHSQSSPTILYFSWDNFLSHCIFRLSPRLLSGESAGLSLFGAREDNSETLLAVTIVTIERKSSWIFFNPNQIKSLDSLNPRKSVISSNHIVYLFVYCRSSDFISKTDKYMHVYARKFQWASLFSILFQISY